MTTPIHAAEGADRRAARLLLPHLHAGDTITRRLLNEAMVEAFGEDFYQQQKEALDDAWLGKASQCEHDIVRKKHIRIVHSTFLPHLRDGEVVTAGATGINGALSLSWKVSQAITLSGSYRYAKNKLGSATFQDGYILGVKYGF